MTKHVMPARLTKKYKEALLIAQNVHKVLGCRGLLDQILNSEIIFFIC